MHDIICPHCNKAFKVDEAGYADILKQVRDADFAAQLHERLELAEQDKRNAVALAQAQVANELLKAAAAKDVIAELITTGTSGVDISVFRPERFSLSPRL